ncbi:Hypothetical predicted protein, partial [Drosophila guanche]
HTQLPARNGYEKTHKSAGAVPSPRSPWNFESAGSQLHASTTIATNSLVFFLSCALSGPSLPYNSWPNRSDLLKKEYPQKVNQEINIRNFLFFTTILINPSASLLRAAIYFPDTAQTGKPRRT